jgi:hypothetical protein
MPDTPGVDLDQYKKEKDEFSSAMDEVFSEDNKDKSDEEIIKDMDAKTADADKGGDGISQTDPIVPADMPPAEEDPNDTPPADGQEPEKDPEPATPAVVEPTSTDPVEQVKLLTAELAKEKQKTSSWAGRITAANTKVKELDIKVATLENAATTADNKVSNETDNATIDKFRADFPEMGDMFDIMQKRIDTKQSTTTVKADSEPTPATPNADIPAGEAEVDNNSGHMAAIRKVHPDLSEMVNTGILLTWINKQPDYIQPTLEAIYRKGTSDKVIKMVTNFKSETGWKSQLDTAGEAAAGTKDGKLNSMLAVNSSGGGPPAGAPDKNDYAQGAKDAGL